MRSDGEATRDRILDAAQAEFARYGLAGARVDRIATAAKASKERLYAYFGDKGSLFTAVLEVNRRDVMAAIPMDTNDLPGFVGRVFDHVVEYPEHSRMLDWARLEGAAALLPTTTEWRNGPEAAAIAAAQARGEIDPSWDPEDLVTLVFSLATSWVHSPGVFPAPGAEPAESVRDRRRAAAIAAARKLIAP
ncbi:TetR family transcriptional regulator [Cryobacterium zhongshanensis]|uniref:TetR family transcriptional regulator n=1 Tax=Cryobacterium zhongshanensis TaxID=2928153 RepID=A0AA41QVX5_9MICO|nr:TetR family transcriptional regulator [Cryobacterium zhongshanensis]MCI4658335.1 TetR family transcriptional regulator [Cryobacterium zhongshanensis]